MLSDHVFHSRSADLMWTHVHHCMMVVSDTMQPESMKVTVMDASATNLDLYSDTVFRYSSLVDDDGHEFFASPPYDALHLQLKLCLACLERT